MYHPGKVVKLFKSKDKEVISSDDAEHALVDMWDEHIFTVLVDKRLVGKVKEGDVVIVDYYPIAPQSQVPKRIITKVLRGKAAADLWKKYDEYKDKQSLLRDLKETHEYMG